MDEATLNIKIAAPFSNLHRDETVLVGVSDVWGNILLGAKEGFYPPGIVRLLGGGIDKGEAPNVAATRELSEELNIAVLQDDHDLEPVAKVSVRATDEHGAEYNTIIWIFYIDIGDIEVRAGDDVTNVIRMDLLGLRQLADSYNALSETLWYKGIEGEFCWADYGKVYGKVHLLMWEHLTKRLI